MGEIYDIKYCPNCESENVKEKIEVIRRDRYFILGRCLDCGEWCMFLEWKKGRVNKGKVLKDIKDFNGQGLSFYGTTAKGERVRAVFSTKPQ